MSPDPLPSGLDLPEVRALFERLCETSLARRALAELEPRSDDGARAALARASEMVALGAAGERPGLGGLWDPEPALAAVHRGARPLEIAELASLADFLGASQRLCAWLEVRSAECPALWTLAGGVGPEIEALHRDLAALLDERGLVRDTATPRLARLRGEIAELEREVVRAVERVGAQPEIRAALSDSKVHRRGGRWVLALKARSAPRVRGLVHGRSQSGETLFVEPEAAVELANRLVERRAEERAELARILVEATRRVLADEPAVQAAAGAMAELELSVAAAAFCRQYGARVPELAAGRSLVLKAARHPLLVEEERQGRLAEVVPIDVRLGDDFDLLVITGPNTGGKTLAVKTVGVAAFSVRMGWPVCCGEGSRVPLYDGLVVDIGDEQELGQSLSTFASHLVRIRAGLERATPRTLVLLDELGGGTDPDEGAALGDAILEYLLERGVPTLVTTHLGRLKEFCFTHARAENASVAFDAVSLRPLYRLLIGTPGESQALVIAERLGLPAPVLARARERLERRDRELFELIAEVRGTREHAEELRTRAEARLLEVSRSRAELSVQAQALSERGAQLAAEAQRALEERVGEARRALEGARGLLDQIPLPAARELAQAFESAAEALAGATLTERRRAFLAGLKKGELVWVPRLKQRCVVARIDRAKGQVSVRLGRMRVELAFDDITWSEG